MTKISDREVQRWRRRRLSGSWLQEEGAQAQRELSRSYERFVRVLGMVAADMRIEQELTQKELALRCGIRQETLCRIEHGSRAPSLWQVYALLRGLGKGSGEFFAEVERIEEVLSGRGEDGMTLGKTGKRRYF